MTYCGKTPKVKLTPQRPYKDLTIAEGSVYSVKAGREQYSISRRGDKYVVTDDRGRAACFGKDLGKGLGRLGLVMLDETSHRVRLQSSGLWPQQQEQLVVLGHRQPYVQVDLGQAKSCTVIYGKLVFKLSQGRYFLFIYDLSQPRTSRGRIGALAPGERMLADNLIFKFREDKVFVSVERRPREIALGTDGQAAAEKIYTRVGRGRRIRYDGDVYSLHRATETRYEVGLAKDYELVFSPLGTLSSGQTMMAELGQLTFETFANAHCVGVSNGGRHEWLRLPSHQE